MNLGLLPEAEAPPKGQWNRNISGPVNLYARPHRSVVYLLKLCFFLFCLSKQIPFFVCEIAVNTISGHIASDQVTGNVSRLSNELSVFRSKIFLYRMVGGIE